MAPCHYKSCTCWVRRGVTRAVLGVRRHSVSVCLSVFAIPTDKLSPNRQRLPQWPRGMEAAVRPLGDQDQHLGLLFSQFSWGKAGFFSGSSSCRGSLSFPRGEQPRTPLFLRWRQTPTAPSPSPGCQGGSPQELSGCGGGRKLRCRRQLAPHRASGSGQRCFGFLSPPPCRRPGATTPVWPARAAPAVPSHGGRGRLRGLRPTGRAGLCGELPIPAGRRYRGSCPLGPPGRVGATPRPGGGHKGSWKSPGLSPWGLGVAGGFGGEVPEVTGQMGTWLGTIGTGDMEYNPREPRGSIGTSTGVTTGREGHTCTRQSLLPGWNVGTWHIWEHIPE